MNYLDTSALIKRFVTEKGSELVRRMIIQSGPIATAKIAYAELFAGLARRHREGDLSISQHSLACKQFEQDWRSYIRMELADDVLTLARDLIRRHPLKGYDAVHLASCLRLKGGLGEQITFVAGDRRLIRVAEAVGLGTVNAETDSGE